MDNLIFLTLHIHVFFDVVASCLSEEGLSSSTSFALKVLPSSVIYDIIN